MKPARGATWGFATTHHTTNFPGATHGTTNGASNFSDPTILAPLIFGATESRPPLTPAGAVESRTSSEKRSQSVFSYKHWRRHCRHALRRNVRRHVVTPFSRHATACRPPTTPRHTDTRLFSLPFFVVPFPVCSVCVTLHGSVCFPVSVCVSVCVRVCVLCVLWSWTITHES